MNLSTELSIPVVISIVSAICAVAASWAVVRFQTNQHDKRISRQDDAITALGKELAAFKVEAVQRFVSDEALAKVEARISDGFNRLADRLDRLVEASPRSRRTS